MFSLVLTEVEILSLGLPEAYQYLLVQAEDPENNIPGAEMEKIRYGYKCHFDLYYFVTGKYISKPKQGLVRIEGRLMTWRDFWSEIEKRNTNIKRLLLNCAGKEPFVP